MKFTSIHFSIRLTERSGTGASIYTKTPPPCVQCGTNQKFHVLSSRFEHLCECFRTFARKFWIRSLESKYWVLFPSGYDWTDLKIEFQTIDSLKLFETKRNEKSVRNNLNNLFLEHSSMNLLIISSIFDSIEFIIFVSTYQSLEISL